MLYDSYSNDLQAVTCYGEYIMAGGRNSLHVVKRVKVSSNYHIAILVKTTSYSIFRAGITAIVIIDAKQKQPGCKKVRSQSEATMVISDQKL